MFATSIILMVAGLIGVLVCASNKRNPAMQPIAVGCLLVILVGFGLYMYDSNFKDKNKANMETFAIRQLSAYNKIGTFLKDKAAGKKAVLIVDGMAPAEQQDQYIKEFEKAFGGSVEVERITPKNPEDSIDSITYKDYRPIINKYKDAGAIVFTIQLPLDMRYTELKAPLVLFQNGELRGNALKRMLNTNKIMALLHYKSYPSDKIPEADEENLSKTFDMFYNLVTKDNFDKFAKEL